MGSMVPSTTRAATAARRAGVAFGLVGAMALVSGFVPGTSAGAATGATLKTAHVGATNPGFEAGSCPESGWGWHFVLPGNDTTFVSVSATFADAGVVTDFTSQPTGMHAYVYTPGPDTLISASATVDGPATTFVLSHVCGGSVATTTTTAPVTTTAPTTVPEVTTTVPPTTTAPPTTAPPTTDAPSTTVPDDDEHQVTLCHATGSTTNPYVKITVDYHSVIQAGHGDHVGPVFDADLPKHTAWGDIIPPFTFGDVDYDGLNWTTEGQALFAGDCTEETETTTTTAPVTTTVPPTTVPEETTTTTAPEETTTTTVPEETTTTTVPEETTTTTAVVGGITREQPAPVAAAPAVARVLGVSVTQAPAAPQPVSVVSAGQLPRTGSSSVLPMVGFSLLVGGLVLLTASRRRPAV